MNPVPVKIEGEDEEGPEAGDVPDHSSKEVFPYPCAAADRGERAMGLKADPPWSSDY
jgi:hypothetical protein